MLHSNRARFVASKNGAGKKSAYGFCTIPNGNGTRHKSADGYPGRPLPVIWLQRTARSKPLDDNFKTLPK